MLVLASQHCEACPDGNVKLPDNSNKMSAASCDSLVFFALFLAFSSLLGVFEITRLLFLSLNTVGVQSIFSESLDGRPETKCSPQR